MKTIKKDLNLYIDTLKNDVAVYETRACYDPAAAILRNEYKKVIETLERIIKKSEDLKQ